MKKFWDDLLIKLHIKKKKKNSLWKAFAEGGIFSGMLAASGAIFGVTITLPVALTAFLASTLTSTIMGKDKDDK